MTFLQAVCAIEAKVKSLKLRYANGDLMEPIVALGRVGKFHGVRYDCS